MHFLMKRALLVLIFVSALHAEDFPITTTFDKAVTGPGYVIMMKNTSDSSLRVKVAALDKTVEQVVDAGSTWKLGHLEGFTFATGDKLAVTVGDKTVQQVIPENKVEPLTVTSKKAIGGSTLVLVLQRNKDTVKDVKVVCERPSNGDKKTLTTKTWGATNQIEYGHTDGWGFEKGDRVTISGEGFETQTKVFE